MSSRKKSRAPRPPSNPPPPPQPPSRTRTLLLGITLGVLVGVVAGTAVFFLNRNRTIDLGTISPATAPSAPTAKEIHAAYAGSNTCRECHAKEYDLWSTSHHGLAERSPDPALDKSAFDPARTFEHGSQKTETRATGDHYEIVTPGYGAKPAAYPVTRVIGVDPLRQFLTPAPGNRLQALEAAYDPRKNQWFNVYGAEDRKFGEWGHWTGRGMNWNSMCANCHNTRVLKGYDEKSDAYQTTMAQLTVSCESCHGPMKQHVEAQRRGPVTSVTGPSRYKLTKDQMLDTCGSCHARRGELTGDFKPGDAFHDHFSLTIPDLSDLFYPDGQVKEEDYELTAFLGSKMHAAGVRCGDCHDPHSSKPLFAGNNLCMRCHNGSFKGSPVIVPEQHSFHKPDGAGNQCVNCHMPQTTYMQRHGRHDHGFTIPDPLLTKEHNIPNACNRCHTDKDADWSMAAVDKWYGPKMQRPTRERARAIAKSRKGDEAARAPLLAMLKEEKQPFWQAVAAAVLSQWATSPDVMPALLTAATDHASPLVRENAVSALIPLATRNDPVIRLSLEKALNDPVRSVRVRAAWALRHDINPASPPGQDLLRWLDTSADQPGGAMMQGEYHLARGDVNTAAAYFAKGVKWDPNTAPLREAYANALILQNHTQPAIEQLQIAARLDPRNAMYHYKVGLAYDKLGQRDPALAALRQAEQVNPSDPDIPYARASIHAKYGQYAEARQAAARALQIDPNYTAAIELLQALR